MTAADGIATAFKWRAGAWVGSQLGPTIWMLITGIRTLTVDRTLAALLLACFFVHNGIALAVWIRRDRYSAYVANQLMLLLVGVTSILANVTIDTLGYWSEYGISDSATNVYWFIAIIIPSFNGLFYLLETRARMKAIQKA
jgi:hypothetical protein